MGARILILGLAAAAVLIAAAAAAIRFILFRAQDRLARRLMSDAGAAFRLLTRAELCTAGKYRRLPGVLGLTGEALVFHGIFDEIEVLPTARIEKILTGTRLSSGRRLFRREVLRATRSGGAELEWVLTRASASAWRSHLGLWAVEQRRAEMEVVSPGKK